jgi:anti-sigma-K factor RskA
MSGRPEFCGDAAPFVLGALHPAEADAFRRHMISCVVCRDELAAFRQVADALPASAPVYPAPKELRRRVLAAAGAPGRPRRRALPALPGLRPMVLAVGALAVAVLVAAGTLALRSEASGGMRVVQANVGSAELRMVGNRGELVVRHLPVPAAGQIYEVWTVRGAHAPSPTGTLFSVTTGGAADVGLPGDLRGVREVLVTREPAGGTLSPTATPVIVERLT